MVVLVGACCQLCTLPNLNRQSRGPKQLFQNCQISDRSPVFRQILFDLSIATGIQIPKQAFTFSQLLPCRIILSINRYMYFPQTSVGVATLVGSQDHRILLRVGK
jgi:hypothetical protein